MLSKQNNNHVESERKHHRVLLIAYACSPNHGSEPGAGWNRAVETAKYFDTWVICKTQRYEDEIKDYFAQHGTIPFLQFVFVPRSYLETIIRNIPGLYYFAYNLWHRRAYNAAVNLHESLHFDLLHQVNMCGFREPGYLWKLDAPFVWGPVGGSQNYPFGFLSEAGIIGAFQEGMRSIINIFQMYFSPRVCKAAEKAAVLLTANLHNKRTFERAHNVEARVLVEVGIRTIADQRTKKYDGSGSLRILWSGELRHNKALQLLIKALAGIPSGVSYKLRVLGKGPVEKRWKKLAKKKGIDKHCQWMGWLPHHEAMAQFDWADILVFTSLRDTTGTVVLEAISRGVPVVCLDHQGVRDIVTPDCGIKIPVTKPSDVILRLREAIVSIAGDNDNLRQLSNGALLRSRDFLWSRNGELMAKIYNEVLGEATVNRRIL